MKFLLGFEQLFDFVSFFRNEETEIICICGTASFSGRRRRRKRKRVESSRRKRRIRRRGKLLTIFRSKLKCMQELLSHHLQVNSIDTIVIIDK